MPPRRPVAVDLETRRIGLEHGPHPPPVCASLAWREGDDYRTWLVAACEAEFESLLERTLRDDDRDLVFVNAAYDLGVLHKHRPALRPAIYAALDAGRVRDAPIEEMLRAASTSGRIGSQVDPDTGETERVRFSLAALLLRYFGEDRTAEKDDPGGWRLRFGELADLRASQYPADAAAYAVQDAYDTLRVFEAQQASPGSVATRELHEAAHVALGHYTDAGLELDQDEVDRLWTAVQAELEDGRHPLLVEAGILQPARPPRPVARGVRDHVPGCDKHGCACSEIQPRRQKTLQGFRHVGYQRRHIKGCPRPPCGCPRRMKAGEPSKTRKGPLSERVLAVCQAKGLTVELTDKGQEVTGRERLYPGAWQDPFGELRHPKSNAPLYVGCAGLALNEMAVHDPVLYQYRHRKRLAKLEQSLAAARAAIAAGYPRIHPNYHPLKETGRTSSYGGSQDVALGERGNLYPSKNIQQEPNPPKVRVEGLEFLEALDVRRQYRPAPGHVFVNADFSSLELVTVAQRMYDLFEVPGIQECMHRRLINGGRNCHTYLGAQIAVEHGDQSEDALRRVLAWRDLRRAVRLGDRVAAHDAFLVAKSADEPEVRAVFKRYRNTAKPVGLGLPGMLGVRKLAFKLAPQYGLDMTLADAKAFKVIWLESYPEMVPWRQYVSTRLRDPYAEGAYWYRSRLGYERRGCTFNAAANGDAMQTPGAEAAKLAVYMVDRAAYDPTRGSVLFGRFRPNLFNHDELGGETPDDWTAHHVATEVGRLMVEALAQVCPDVRGEAEPLLSYTWSKAAEPTYDPAGRLVPWTPPA